MNFLLDFASALGWGAGLTYGFAMAVVAYLFKQAFLEPLYELVVEWIEKAIRPPEILAAVSQPPELTASETFVISDLHIDTWHKVPLRGGKTQVKHFEEFLDTIKQSAMELYINGDIIDLPPHPSEVWSDPTGTITFYQTMLPKYVQVFKKLAKFTNGYEPDEESKQSMTAAQVQKSIEASRTMTMYMPGNHDLAGSGVRYLLQTYWDLLPEAKLPFQNVWYGHFMFYVPYNQDKGERRFRYFLEHGHYHDPVLVLYLLQFVVSAIASNLEAAMDSLSVGGQRRTSSNVAPPPPGIVVGPSQPTPPTWATAPATSSTYKENLGHRLVRLRWRLKARRQLARLNRMARKAKEDPLDGILMGHTHLPDYYVFRLGGVNGKVYVNTGDWSGDTGHATYAVIGRDGIIRLYDWHTNRAPHHRPGAILERPQIASRGLR